MTKDTYFNSAFLYVCDSLFPRVQSSNLATGHAIGASITSHKYNIREVTIPPLTQDIHQAHYNRDTFCSDAKTITDTNGLRNYSGSYYFKLSKYE